VVSKNKQRMHLSPDLQGINHNDQVSDDDDILVITVGPDF
jgi:hypothetical protein